MFTVEDRAAGPHDASLDHERLVLEARDVEFDWAKLPFHYVPGEPFTTHVLNARLNFNLTNKWLTTALAQYDSASGRHVVFFRPRRVQLSSGWAGPGYVWPAHRRTTWRDCGCWL